MDQATISAIASDLMAGRQKAIPVQRPSERHKMEVADGYAIAREIMNRRLAGGDKVVGLKLGFTNPAVWPAVGLTGPLWAPVFASNYTEAAEVQLPRMRAPEVEPELVFGLKQDVKLSSAQPSAQELMSLIEWWALGFEIIDTGYPPGKPVIPDQIADHCAHQKLIVGSKQPLGKVDPEIMASFTCELFRDGEMVCAGAGKDVMGNPLKAVEWFTANRFDGIAWPAKQAIPLTTGRLGTPPALPTGMSRWELRSTLPLPTLLVSISRPE